LEHAAGALQLFSVRRIIVLRWTVSEGDLIRYSEASSERGLIAGRPTRSGQLCRQAVFTTVAWLVAIACCCIVKGQTAEYAQSALDHGDYSSAETGFQQLLNLQPNSPELWTNLGIALQAQGKSTLAIQAFQRALKLRFLPNAYALLAEEKCELRDLDGARPMLSRILREQEANGRMIAVVAPCYLELDEPLDSIEVYRRLMDQPFFPDDLARIQLIRSYLKAAQHFMRELEASPEGTAYIRAIQIARDSGSTDARSAYSLAERSSPYFKGDLNFLEAMKVWQDHPKDAALLYQMSVLCGEEILRQVNFCEDRYQGSPYFEQFRADAIANQHHLDEASAMYESLIKRYPQLPELRYSLGMLYIEQEQWSKALAVFREQLTDRPGDERAANRISQCLIKLQQYQELRLFLRPWVEKENSPLWVHLDLAAVFERADLPGDEIKELMDAEKESPDDRSIHFRLLTLDRRVGDQAGIAHEAKELKRLQAKAAHSQ
jgi:predicted Zn-dependent protease